MTFVDQRIQGKAIEQAAKRRKEWNKLAWLCDVVCKAPCLSSSLPFFTQHSDRVKLSFQGTTGKPRRGGKNIDRYVDALIDQSIDPFSPHPLPPEAPTAPEGTQGGEEQRRDA
mmetsp:Transcript_14103/g.28285  ORF Transcript_14103/g.28285 Transcript_14103/m.28285 type:complete len:113 (+) Transcript_14103:635-973(+)